MTYLMQDAVTTGNIDRNVAAVALYVNGRYANYNQRNRFGNAVKNKRVLGVSVFAGGNGDCLDIEKGDAVPAQAPAWVQAQHKHGVVKPVLYASVSAMPFVLAEMNKAGIPRNSYKLWTAHYTGKPHLCDSSCGFGFNDHADATQFSTDPRVDTSLCKDDFFYIAPPPPDPYRFFSKETYVIGAAPTGRKLIEYSAVKNYDALAKHPLINRSKLQALQHDLAFLRDNVWEETKRDGRLPNGRFNWAKENRGYRYNQLVKRAPNSVRPSTR